MNNGTLAIYIYNFVQKYIVQGQKTNKNVSLKLTEEKKYKENQALKWLYIELDNKP